MEKLYVIKCAANKYYVGKTNDVMRRFEEHKSGKGSSWTSKYKPIDLLESRPLQGEHDENNKTKDLMKIYGIENVRGGSYTQIVLSPEVISVLQKEIIGNSDKCYKCNLAGHVASYCPNIEKVSSKTDNLDSQNLNNDEIKELKKQLGAVKRNQKYKVIAQTDEEWGCNYCDRTFTTKFGCNIHEKSCVKTVEEWGCEYCDRTFTTKYGATIHEKSCMKTIMKDRCYKCGREGHYSPDCYAKKDIAGNEIYDN